MSVLGYSEYVDIAMVMLGFSIMAVSISYIQSQMQMEYLSMSLRNTSALVPLCCLPLWVAAQYRFTGSISHNDTANLRPEVNVCVSFSSHLGVSRL